MSEDPWFNTHRDLYAHKNKQFWDSVKRWAKSLRSEEFEDLKKELTEKEFRGLNDLCRQTIKP